MNQDRQAQFDAYFLDHRARMWRIARAYAPDTPDDLFQELALQFWQSLARFEGKCELTTWAYRVHLNTAMSWRRRAARRRRLPITSSATEQLIDPASNNTESIDLDIRLKQILEALGETDRGVLLMLLDNIPTEQIADVMGVSEGAIRVRLHRIRKRIEEGNV